MLSRKLLWLCLAVFQAAVASAQLSPADLYQQLAASGLDDKSAIAVRNASIDREDLHISLHEGTLAFVKAVDGKVTGAVFAGEGEVLVIPPIAAERQSMALFTGGAVLNERFRLAYLRFDDPQVAETLRRAAKPSAEAEEAFAEKYAGLAGSLSSLDALALTRNLSAQPHRPGYLHGRFVGQKLGTFDMLFDASQPEQLVVLQVKHIEQAAFADIWSAFCLRSMRTPNGACKTPERPASISAYHIDTTVSPPRSISTQASLRLAFHRDGERVLLFQLASELNVESVTTNGKPLPVLPPVREGDVVGVVLPGPSVAGQQMELVFRYSGPVLSDAGGGLVYMRERGRWYPTLGLEMSDYDLAFRHPAAWRLLATGKKIEDKTQAEVKQSRWKSERPLPFAGFSLGQYIDAKVVETDGLPRIVTYASRSVEAALQTPQASAMMEPLPLPTWQRRPRPRIPILPPPPPPTIDPSKNAGAVAEQAARTVSFLQSKIGKFPYSSLNITQIPGTDSQGFPGLIYLSSYVFLTPDQRWRGRIPDKDAVINILYNRVMAAHETAHQWWGDAVTWSGYRDQWLSEAISNYLAVMQLEDDAPDYFAAMLDYYRERLLADQKPSHLPLRDAGAVTLGIRLNSSRFPSAYEGIAYGRGTWMMHMLRQMLRDASVHPVSAVRSKGVKARSSRPAQLKDPDELYFSVLRALQQDFAGKAMTTADLQGAFEKVLPRELHFDGNRSLEWFFDGWVNGVAVPDIRLESVRIRPRAGKLIASFTIEQEECPESLVTSVPIYGESKNGERTFLRRVFADGRSTDLSLEVPAGTSKLLLDPFRTVLRK